MVPHLGLLEKGFSKDEYDVKSIGLGTSVLARRRSSSINQRTVAAENFDPDYIEVNPNGTVPSLASAHLSSPLVDSRDVLEHLDQLRPDTNKLSSSDPGVQAKVNDIIGIVHDDKLSTNLVLLQARNKEEMEAKRAGMWKTFVANRQGQLEKHNAQLPDHPFYSSKLKEQTPLYELYTAEAVDGPQFEAFFKATHDGYREFAAGLDRLDKAIVLPYVAGEQLTHADLHVVPWLSHAMWGAGATDVHDFAPLEGLIGKTVPGFKVGDRIKEWWANISQRESFKEVYPSLH
jgi:glutathione S-transferase